MLPWTIIGSDARGGAPLIGHVSLLAKEVPGIRQGDMVPIHHMKPPLETIVPELDDSEGSDASEDDEAMARPSPSVQAHVVGWVDDLSDEERQGMRNWIRDLSTRFGASSRPSTWPFRARGGLGDFLKASQYVVNPPYEEVLDPRSGTPKMVRCSCAGFVLKGYDAVGIRLLADWRASDFPRMDAKHLAEIYIDVSRLEQADRRTLGLAGDDSWPVVLPGYVIHSVNRSKSDVREQPHMPTRADRAFPHLRDASKPDGQNKHSGQ